MVRKRFGLKFRDGTTFWRVEEIRHSHLRLAARVHTYDNTQDNILFTMTKFAVAATTLIVTMLTSSVTAFSPPPSVSTSSSSSSALYEFANGMVGGEGPEPMPFNFFAGEKTAKNFDPVGFAEVRRNGIECVNRESVRVC